MNLINIMFVYLPIFLTILKSAMVVCGGIKFLTGDASLPGDPFKTAASTDMTLDDIRVLVMLAPWLLYTRAYG